MQGQNIHEKPKFSKEQTLAINTRDRTLLVSAAAGSGKSTTLTERIIQSLLSKDDPQSIKNMLIVTFTNSSVYDLKKKISTALKEAVAENPGNERLKEELFSLDFAKIQTIDSFCADLIKMYAEKIGISPSYRICQGAEAAILKKGILNTLIEAIYKGQVNNIAPGEFEILADALTGVKNTNSLTDVLINIYDKVNNTVLGVDIFKHYANNYMHFSDVLLEETEYFKHILSMIKNEIQHLRKILSLRTEALLASGIQKEMMLADTLDEANKKLAAFADLCVYEEIQDACNSFSFGKAPSFKEEEKSEQFLLAIEIRDKIKESIKAIKNNLISYTRSEWKELYRNLAASVETLHKVLSAFSSLYFREKIKKACLEFSDTERLAYNLLYDGDKPSETALAMREQYTSVYIDEYQDVNELQNKIFEAVSPKTGRFMVGDIKQSIYGFRGGKPEIFANLKASFNKLENGEYSTESSIFMSENYRCDEGVIDFVNSVFDKLFGLRAQSIGYVSEDRLQYKKKYTDFKPEYEKVKIYLLHENTDKSAACDEYEVENSEQEESASTFEDDTPTSPKFIAKKIQELITYGKRRDGTPIKPSDIAVLFRTKKRIKDYETALNKLNIPASATEDRDFFLNKEILLVISFLTSIDNPRKDIYLASIMCSPLYSFTADELVAISKLGAQSTLYDSAQNYLKNNPSYKKLADFLDTLSHYRTISEGISVDSLLSRLYTDTPLLTLAGKAGGRENLLKLYSYAKNFEKNGYKGLYNFLSFINNVIESEETIDKNQDAGADKNAVHLGSIHSAKGLEFPIVFLAEATNEIKNLDVNNKIAFHEDFGISFLLRAPQSIALVNNPIQKAVIDFMNKKHFEEITRLLYVALTRAKEKLFVVGLTKEDPEEYLKKMDFSAKTLTPFSLGKMKTYMDMILSSSPTADIEKVQLTSTELHETEEKRESREKEKEDFKEVSENQQAQSCKTKNNVSIILERFKFEYPNTPLTKLPEKISVSKLYPSILDKDENTLVLNFESNENEDEQRPVPIFINPQAENVSAKRGIATHTFMQFFNIENLKRYGVDAEIKRLYESGFLSSNALELIRKDELILFTKSELLDKMENAVQIYREFRFNTTLPSELFTLDDKMKSLCKGKSVFVQGVLDCLLVNGDGSLTLIDYKTDRLTRQELENEELAKKKLCEKHTLQLSYYALAVEKIFGKKPARVGVYSLPLGKTIDLCVMF